MVRLYESGAYLVNGDKIVVDEGNALEEVKHISGVSTNKEMARKGTIAYSILESHNLSDSREHLSIRFDKMASHDITFVGIIQTARASGLDRFPLPYVMTNCHNSLCAVGGTINEDDHVFGLTAAKRYGGIYVPPHQAVIHQYAREEMATCGGMILGSDSHTRYGALGTMAVGEGGPELVKQLLGQTYDIDYPDVVGVYLTGSPIQGVGPQDIALAIIGEVFNGGYVKNKVMEFVGPGISNLSADFRIGIDVMTTETTCLSSIWRTDEIIKDFYITHNRADAYIQLNPDNVAYYDGLIEIDLSTIRPMIAMPFHPANTYVLQDVIDNPYDVFAEVENKAKISLGDDIEYSLANKIINGKIYVEQGIIAGCAGGGFENICAAADILKDKYIGSDIFTLSVYPSSMPVNIDLIRNGCATTLLESGAVMKTAFCGPCFGAGDTPANGAFSIRHTTRNFPNREGSKLQNGQISSVALMDARSIATTAANQGYLTSADRWDGTFGKYRYHYDSQIYKNRVFNGIDKSDTSVEVVMGPNIKDWPKMSPLPKHLLLQIVSKIEDPVTTTDELIPSGETSSYRSNPLGLAEYTLSRKDPKYVSRAKNIMKAQIAMMEGNNPTNGNEELQSIIDTIQAKSSDILVEDMGFGSTIFAKKPGDGSAREQAASCQKVLGGWANIAFEYATKRYRSNLINWGMLPLLIEEKDLNFENLEYVFLPDIKSAIENKSDIIKVMIIGGSGLSEIEASIGTLTDDERQIIIDGCLINYNRHKLG